MKIWLIWTKLPSNSRCLFLVTRYHSCAGLEKNSICHMSGKLGAILCYMSRLIHKHDGILSKPNLCWNRLTYDGCFLGVFIHFPNNVALSLWEQPPYMIHGNVLLIVTQKNCEMFNRSKGVLVSQKKKFQQFGSILKNIKTS